MCGCYNKLMNKKGFIPIIAILIIVILSSIGYVTYKNFLKTSGKIIPVPTPTSFPNTYSNWKVYDLGEKTFKLPNDWTENKVNNNDTYFSNGDQTISIHKEETDLNLESFFNKGKDDTKFLRGGDLGSWIENKVLIDNQPAIKVETLSTENQSKKLNVYTVISPKDNVAIVITIDNEFENINEFVSSITFGK